MEDLSALDNLSQFGESTFYQPTTRRQFGKAGLAAGLLPAGWFGLGNSKQSECPIRTIREKRFDTLTAILAAQIDSLWCGHLGDHPGAVANETLRYASYLPHRMQVGMNVALLCLDIYSFKHTCILSNTPDVGSRATPRWVFGEY